MSIKQRPAIYQDIDGANHIPPGIDISSITTSGFSLRINFLASNWSYAWPVI